MSNATKSGTPAQALKSLLWPSLFNVNSFDLGPILLDLGNSHDQNAVLELGSNVIPIHLLLLLLSRWKLDRALKHSNFPLARSQSLQELLIAVSVHHASDAQDALI